IGRAWSCRSPFGRCAPFDHQRKLCNSFLAIHALRRNHDRRERIALIIKRREGTVGLQTLKNAYPFGTRCRTGIFPAPLHDFGMMIAIKKAAAGVPIAAPKSR